MNEIGELLKELRGKKSIREVSKDIGISHTYLSTLEKGYDPRTKKERKPTPEVLRKLSHYYNIPYIQLMELAGYGDQGEYTLIETFGGSSRTPVKRNQFDIYSILQMNADVYFKDKHLSEDDKKFLIDLLERTFGHN